VTAAFASQIGWGKVLLAVVRDEIVPRLVLAFRRIPIPLAMRVRLGLLLLLLLLFLTLLTRRCGLIVP
jgi:hypothetical protein